MSEHPLSRRLTDHNDSYTAAIANLEEDMAMLADNGWEVIGDIGRPYVEAVEALQKVRDLNARIAEFIQAKLDGYLEAARRPFSDQDLRGL